MYTYNLYICICTCIFLMLQILAVSRKAKKWSFQIKTAVVLDMFFHLNAGHASISMIVHDFGMFGELKNVLLHRYSQISAVCSNTQLDHPLQKRSSGN